MWDATGRLRKLINAAVLLPYVSCSLGCSIVSEQLPPSDPSQRTKRAAKQCSDVIYPLADTASTAASISWILLANGKIEDNQPKPEGYRTQYGVTAYFEADPGNPSQVSRYEVLRGVAYASTALFALSAIYGWVVEAQCATLRKEVEGASPKVALASSTQPRFPHSVLDFEFDLRPGAAEQVCSVRGGTWSFEDNVGLCSWPADAAKPSVRLAFELGVPSRITVIYAASAAQLPTNYSALAASMHKLYGAPQVAAAPPSAACATGLARCLENGEHVAGPVWRWAQGTIELSPAWQGDRAVIELRYVHDVSGTP